MPAYSRRMARPGPRFAKVDAMAEFPAPNAGTAVPQPPVSAALLAYALFGVAAVVAFVSSGFHFVAPLMGLVGIAGLIVAYVKRDDARGTWVASHLRWLIRTFWFSLLWAVIGWIVLITLGLILIGIPIAIVIWGAASIWVLYRVIRGYLLFNDNKPVPGM
jgi:uncharacterized membrane protein